MVPSETIRYDQSTLYQAISQLGFTQKDNQPARSDENLAQNSQTEIKLVKKADNRTKINGRIITWKRPSNYCR